MGLFDKEKLSAIANKAKDTVKESISDAITEQQRRKELNLLGSTVISKLEYKGGHPDLTKEKDCTIKADDDYLGDNKYCLFGSRVILLLFDGCTGFGNNRFGSCYSVYYSSHIQEM